MKTCAVVFKSVYGSTQKYADWIKDELDGDLFELDDVRLENLSDYQNIVIGVPVFEIENVRLSSIKKLLNRSESTRLFIIFVSLGLVAQRDLKLDLLRKLKERHRNRVHLYALPGAIDYARLSLKHKAALAIVYRHQNKIVPSKRGEETTKFLDTYGKFADFTDKKHIKILIEDCRK
jgi:menaquinone-dependent protoporphyrinogen IX oxidase